MSSPYNDQTTHLEMHRSFVAQQRRLAIEKAHAHFGALQAEFHAIPSTDWERVAKTAGQLQRCAKRISEGRYS